MKNYSDAHILKKDPDLVARSVGPETIVMPLSATSKDMSYIWSLNDSASRVWDLIDGKRSVRTIKQVLTREFDVTEDELDRELSSLLNYLRQIKAIR